MNAQHIDDRITRKFSGLYTEASVLRVSIRISGSDLCEEVVECRTFIRERQLELEVTQESRR